MKLTPEIFRIDAPAACAMIEEFIRSWMTAMKRSGIAVPISGGLDSSVTAMLCIRAVGADNVTGVLLPEKRGNPDAKKFALRFARDAGIRTETIPVSNMLRAAGAYEFIAEKVPFRGLLKKLVAVYMARSGKNLFLEGLRGSDEAMVRKGLASIYTKQRIRMVALCRYADLHNYMFAGSAHLSEDMLGLFVKFGIDDVADIMPLKNLFRTQILQLAEYLGVPDYIIERTPNPDMLPGIDDKYSDILGINAEESDLVLAGVLNGMTDDDIASPLGIPLAAVKTVRELTILSQHMRHHSYGPDIAEQAVK